MNPTPCKVPNSALYRGAEEGRTLKEIADEFGVSHQAVGQRMHKLGLSAARILSKHGRMERASQDRINSHLCGIAHLHWLKAQVLQAGLHFEAIASTDHPPKSRVGAVRVENLPCHVKLCTWVKDYAHSGPGFTGYAHFYFKTPPPELITLCVVALDSVEWSVYVIPTKLLRESIYIPVRKREPYNNILPKVDWTQFKGNWDIFHNLRVGMVA